MDYFVWGNKEDDKSLAWIRSWPEVIDDKNWMLDKGISCADWFPENPKIQIYAGKGVKLSDAIPNYSDMLVVTEKLKDLFEQESGAKFEFFPVTIMDKKGRPEKQPYYVANLLETVDCVDMGKSSYVMGSLNKTQVKYFKELILDESKIPEDKAMFRLKDKTNLIIINDPFSDLILEAGCIGARFQSLKNHGKIHRD